MARMPYADVDGLPDVSRSLLGPEPLNITRMMVGASPRVAHGFTAFASALFKADALPPRLREIAILRVGHLSGSAYEVYQHEALGRILGLTDEDFQAIAAGGAAAERLGQDAVDIVAFVDDLVHNVRASDATLDAVRKHLNQQQVLDLILAVGCYMMVCRFLETTGVDLDDRSLDWAGAMRK